jgi:hypothetical protein
MLIRIIREERREDDPRVGALSMAEYATLSRRERCSLAADKNNNNIIEKCNIRNCCMYNNYRRYQVSRCASSATSLKIHAYCPNNWPNRLIII